MSLSTKPSQPSVSERRGQRLAPLQTNFSRPTSQIVTNVAFPRPQRPRPSDYDNDKAERVPLQPAPIKRQSSKSSLRNIFSRERSARKSSDAKLSGINEVQTPVKQAQEGTTAPLSPRPCATPKTATSTSTLVAPSQSANLNRSKLQQKHRTTSGEELPPAEDLAWKPPPLFQAYPQGIKHTTLPAPLLSGDSIMRLHATFKARGSSLQEDDQQANQAPNEESSEDSPARKKKMDKEKLKYKRALSENIEKGEWTRRVYVLATSGYILQYAGEGKHDRLPEKMLLLGPKSVAFASDAIPGKHWVLQVSQSSEDESTNPVETSRPRFSRLGFHRSHARRIARNFLLVFNDPEEMSSWLLAIRAQIEARGGKKYVSERVYDEGMESQLRTTPSMRQLVKKDPNRFSTVFLQPRQSMVISDKESSVGDQSRRSSYISVHRRSMVIQPPRESRSGSVSTAQTEVVSTADEPGRFYPSLGSPTIPDSSVISEAESSVTGRSSPTTTISSPKKRRSMFLPQMTRSEIAEIPRAQSTVPEAQFRNTSPPAPNFSVPSFSKRFAARQDVPHVPRLPAVPKDPPDDTSIDTLSMLSSPPQSPGLPIIAQADTRERRLPSLDRRDNLLKKNIRTSNSEDSLADTSQDGDRDRSRLRFRHSHLPESNNTTTSLPGRSTSASASSSPRPATATPVNLNLGVKPSVPAVTSTSPKPTTSHGEKPDQPPHGSLSNKKLETDFTNLPPPSSIKSRRKSLNGLSIGPPVAPPPNCPLPKIPSAFIKPSPQSAWPEHSPPTSPVEDAERALAMATFPSPPSSTNTQTRTLRYSYLPRTTRSAVNPREMQTNHHGV